MNKLFLALCLMIVSSIGALAQSSDYKKAEFYVGYSNNEFDTGTYNNNNGNAAQNFFNNRLSFNGFEVAGVANVSRYFGIKGDVSGAYRNKNFNTTTGSGTTANNISFGTKNSVYNFLGGVQVKDNSSDARIKPFAHAMVGLGYTKTKFDNVNCSNSTVTGCSGFFTTSSDKGVAGAFGGGLDIKVNDRLDVRAIQIDYNPIRLYGQTSNNFRFGVGINIK